MRPNYTHLIIVLDKSGSMADLASDTIGGVNRLVAEQKALPGNFTSSLYLFNQFVSEVVSFVALDTTNYQPQGSTALLDAVCTAIDQEGLELSRLPEQNRPDKVVVLIVTDAQENASLKFKREDERTRIKTQTDTYKWQFVFLGANIDAFAEASSLGISPNSTQQFDFTSQGITYSYCSTSRSMANYRADKTTNVDMTDMTATPVEITTTPTL